MSEAQNLLTQIRADKRRKARDDSSKEDRPKENAEQVKSKSILQNSQSIQRRRL